MTELSQTRPNSAVFLVDGITRGIAAHFTPDISWRAYCTWLKRRRPDLGVIHLEQPHDWMQLILSRPTAHEELMESMVARAMELLPPRLDSAVILGFSLGGLTALHATMRIAQLAPRLLPDYLALVTIGTPFKGTGRLLDMLIRRLPYDYFQHMFAVEQTREYLDSLLEFGLDRRLALLIGEIARDEMVSASSALAPVHWLTGRALPDHLRWGTFEIECGRIIRAHDGLLNDPIALGYIDGLLDGLLPPPGATRGYVPFEPAGT